MWSVRCQHEASLWDNNAFLTLTYDDAHLPPGGTLVREDANLFIRYLRRELEGVEVAPDGRKPIRFFGCGEYGSRRLRAHYHFLLFNVRFPDLVKYGSDTCTSELVSKLWKKGTVQIVPRIEPGSAKYVCGYATKKGPRWGKRGEKIGVVDPETGECLERIPEFPMMSRMPGIGHWWYEKYKSELRNGFVVVDGQQLPVPRLYRDKLAVDDPQLHEQMEWQRYQKAAAFDPADRSAARLAAREDVARSRKSFFKRDHLED